MASKYKFGLRQAAKRMLCSILGAVLVHLFHARAPPRFDRRVAAWPGRGAPAAQAGGRWKLQCLGRGVGVLRSFPSAAPCCKVGASQRELRGKILYLSSHMCVYVGEEKEVQESLLWETQCLDFQTWQLLSGCFPAFYVGQ